MSENPETTDTDTGTPTDSPELPPPVVPPDGDRPASSVTLIAGTIAVAIAAFWILQLLLNALGSTGGG